MIIQKKTRQKFVSIACPQVVLDQLDALVRASGEGRSALIKRLISEAFAKIDAKKK